MTGGSDISVSETLTHRALQSVYSFLSPDMAANSANELAFSGGFGR
jgi:hypothetical protein